MKPGTFTSVAALLLLEGFLTAASWAQGTSYPADGETDVPTTLEMTWPATDGATGYYLYVGTAPRTRDVVNSGEIPATSYVVDGLPANTALYATFWAKVDGAWIYAGSVGFTTSETASPSMISELQTPAATADGIPRTLTFTWNQSPSATSYYLYVGSTSGARDIGNSGEISATSYRVSDMPLDEVVHVRLWTKLSGTWRFRDYSFLVLGNATSMTRPLGGAERVDPATTFEWHSLFGATAYYLYLGTSPGKKDIIDSGETTRTSWPNTPLAGGTTYYARLHSKVAGTWYSRDYTLNTDDVSLLTTPKNNQIAVDPATSFHWMPVAGADKYYLYVGSAPGLRDVVNGGETTQLKLSSRALPGGVPLYARMYVKKAGIWTYRDSVFTTRASPRFISPKHGQVGVGSSTVFQWSRVMGAERYTLSVGTTPGDDDIVGATTTTGTELSVNGLPVSRALYATIASKVDGIDVAGQAVFSTTPSTSAAWLITPLDGGTLSAGTSIKWRPAPLARAYRLEVGAAPGSADLIDTGEINVTERFVEQLPTGVPVYARLTTYFLSGTPYEQSFTFTKLANDFPLESRFTEAERATAFIRNQAFGNLPTPNGLVAGVVFDFGKDYANCVDYAEALVLAIEQLGLQVRARTGAACLVPNAYDCHTYTEVENEDTHEWFVLDPTFGISARRASDLAFATAADISAATREQRWDAIEYEALTSVGFQYLESYYIDYPLMFFHRYDVQIARLLTPEESVLHLYEQVESPFESDSVDSVAVRCPVGETSTPVLIGNVEYHLTCSGIDNLSEIFPASSVVPVGPAPQTVEIYRSLRFAFPNN